METVELELEDREACAPAAVLSAAVLTAEETGRDPNTKQRAKRTSRGIEERRD